MPKLKTKKAVSKRFKITGTGKVIKNSANRRHLLGDKSPSRKRQLRRPTTCGKVDTARVMECLPYA